MKTQGAGIREIAEAIDNDRPAIVGFDTMSGYREGEISTYLTGVTETVLIVQVDDDDECYYVTLDEVSWIDFP